MLRSEARTRPGGGGTADELALAGHRRKMTTMAVDASQRYAATAADEDPTIQIWNASTTEAICEIKHQPESRPGLPPDVISRVASLSFSGCGWYLVVLDADPLYTISVYNWQVLVCAMLWDGEMPSIVLLMSGSAARQHLHRMSQCRGSRCRIMTAGGRTCNPCVVSPPA